MKILTKQSAVTFTNAVIKQANSLQDFWGMKEFEIFDQILNGICVTNETYGKIIYKFTGKKDSRINT